MDICSGGIEIVNRVPARGLQLLCGVGPMPVLEGVNNLSHFGRSGIDFEKFLYVGACKREQHSMDEADGRRRPFNIEQDGRGAHGAYHCVARDELGR